MLPLECNADLGNPCDAGGLDDNGDPIPCLDCQASYRDSHAEAWREWQAASPEERDPEGYRRDMVDAGRGHLLRDP
jgi:hypothetical protein